MPALKWVAVLLCCAVALTLCLFAVGCLGSGGNGTPGILNGGGPNPPPSVPTGSLLIVIIGAACVVGGCVLGIAVLKDLMMTVAGVLAGFMLIAAAWYPWTLWVTYGICVLAGGYLVWSNFFSTKLNPAQVKNLPLLVAQVTGMAQDEVKKVLKL